MGTAALSIISVNYRSVDWIRLLVHSVRRCGPSDAEILVVNNSREVFNLPGVSPVSPVGVPHHWMGIETGIRSAHGEWVLVLDADAHILRDGWFGDMLSCFADPGTMLIAAEGSLSKPYRPCVMFFRRSYFLGCGSSFKPYSQADSVEHAKTYRSHPGPVYFDVGVDFALRTIDHGFRVIALPVTGEGYQCRKENAWGTVYSLNSTPTFYHHAYGSRFSHGAKEIDQRSRAQFERAKSDLFAEYQERFGPLDSFESA